jgi:transcriptional regulator with XRE-family HTH domain
MPVNNHQFADAVGCNYTMASRLRSGNRRPSADMLARICRAYNLDEGEALRKHAEGPEALSAWLREKVFNAPSPDADDEVEDSAA